MANNSGVAFSLLFSIYIYTAKMLNWLSVACVAQLVGHVNIAHYNLTSALLVRIPFATFIIVTIEKTIVNIFIKFSPFAISFLYFNKFDLFDDTNILFVGSVTLYFKYRLSSLQLLKYELRYEISFNVAF